MAKYKPGHRALRRGRASIPSQTYLITATTYRRTNHFSHFHAACLASSCFEDSKLIKDAAMLSWVLMPDHAHWLIQLGEQLDLSSLIRRIKSESARTINDTLQSNGSLWAKGFHDRALRKDEDIPAAARYLVANPLRAGLVERIGDYPFWNAVWL